MLRNTDRKKCPKSIADTLSGEKVFSILRSSVDVDWREYVALVSDRLDREEHPFAVLVGIILSQNTNDKNSIKAYMLLRKKVGVSPEEILNAPEEKIIEAIRIAGLWRQKTRALKEAARKIIEAGGERILVEKDWKELRKMLLEIPGVGQKTVDVFLSLVRKAPVFAVDTHAFRIAKRWGLVGNRAGYEETSRALLEFFGPDKSEEAHRLLIALGRKYCRARNPDCSKCPLREYCPYYCRVRSM